MAKVAVDIDDTLYSFTDEAREQLSLMVDEPEYAPYKTQLLHALYAKWDQWRTPYELCGNNAEGESLWLKCIDRCHDDEAILRQQPFVGAVEVCRELLDAGHELVYISNRNTETKEATAEWLFRNGFWSLPQGYQDDRVFEEGGATSLVITNGDKRPFIKDCQYMIDDRVKNVLDFIYDYAYETEIQETALGYTDPQEVYDGLKRKAFVTVTDFNNGLTDVSGLYLAHTWAGLRRYMVKTGLLPERTLVSA